MFKLFALILFSFINILTFQKVFAEKNELKMTAFPAEELEWEYDDSNFDNQLNWYEVDEKEIKHVQIKNKNLLDDISIYSVRSTGKAVIVNGSFYPDISNYVPNAYVEDPAKSFGLSLRGISKTRFCKGKNFSSSCTDGILDLDFKLFNNNDFSIYPKVSMQSLTNRGTNFGEGISLGVKIAKEISPDWSIAFGGENIVHFDDSIDLGHNFYLVASTYIPLNFQKKSTILFFNAGLGSDFFGYKGNGYLFRTQCGSNPLTATSKLPNSCSWGPIFSTALSLNDRFSLISEWFGYSYGAGFSMRPFKDSSLSVSFFATDFIKGFPKYAEELCHNSICETRFYGTIGLNF